MQAKPHGSWKSPITASMVVDETIKMCDIVVDGEAIYWNEMRPIEQGRSVIVRWQGGQVEDVLPPPYNARSRVHEYGGSAFIVSNNIIYFSHFSDQHLYKLLPNGTILAVSRSDKKRYANLIADSQRNLLYGVQEEHCSNHTVTNTLVTIDPEACTVEVLHEGWDFYGMPALHPQGTHIAFITWNHPNMPWDGSTLWVGRLSSNGALIHVDEIAGGVGESIFQPQWSSDGTLYFISDRTGFWNLYRIGEGGVKESCFPMAADFGQPLWVLGLSRYLFLPSGKIASIYTIKGTDFLGILDPNAKKMATLNLPFTTLNYLQTCNNKLYFIGASPTEMHSLICYDFKTIRRLRRSKKLSLDPGYISIPETVEFPTENGRRAFGFFYPPKSRDYIGTDCPPLIVKSHGGPANHATSALSLEVQFWTSRGIAFFDVNYGGSTGFGREYRERLKEQWGRVDSDDCANGVLYLAQHGRVDQEKIIIKGSSSGGYTALTALIRKALFKAAGSYYGISDLEALIRHTHKFESHYLDSLIGPYPACKDKYLTYSPIYHANKLSRPVILFQGEEDRVVTPYQSEILFNALNKQKIPVAYLLFKGEQHGFRIAENIKRSLNAELYFYSQILHFVPYDAISPIKIYNFP